MQQLLLLPKTKSGSPSASIPKFTSVFFGIFFPSTALKFLAVAMAMSKCRSDSRSNHRTFAL